MNILFAVHHFPPRYSGGAELRAYRTAAALQPRGHFVRVVCVEHIDLNTAPRDGSLHDETARGLTCTVDHYDGIETYRLSFNLAEADDPFKWGYDNPQIEAFFREWLPLWNPDVFHLIGGYLISASALRAARSHHIPRVVTLTDFWWLCPRIQLLRSDGSLSTLPIQAVRCARCLGEEKRRYRWLGKIAPSFMNLYWELRKEKVRSIAERTNLLRQELNQVDRIICPSRFLLETHRAAGIAADKLVYSRQGRDFAKLDPAALTKTPANHLRIGYIGQIAEIKGVHVLLEAVQKIAQDNLQVVVYGNLTPFPRYTARLQASERQDKRIRLAGMYERHEVSRVFREIDVLVVPSLWYENSPNVILEAFAHRTPVLVSNLGGMAELVEDGKNGLLFAVGNANDLARQIHRLLNEPGLLAALQNGIQPVKTTAQEMDELEALYQSVSSESHA